MRSFLKNHNSFLIVSHKNPDGDAFGSEIAVGLGLKKMKKEFKIVASDAVPKRFRHFELKDMVKREVGDFKYDAIIVLDSADKYRLGPIVEQIDFSKSLANIDHHISNAYFGTLNIVKPNLSSTCEIVYEIIKDIINIDKDIATYLYLGILTDTGSFRYANTNANSLRSASELLTYGVDASLVSERVWFRDSLNRIKLLGDVLETLVVEDGFSLMWVNQDMMKKRGANEEDTEEFVNYGLTLDGVRVAAILKERAGRELKISLRSKKGTDVNLIAKEYGGGGHQNAAGFTVKNKTITEFMPELKKKIKGLI